MIGHRGRRQEELFVSGSLKDLIPKEHILRKVDRVLKLDWLSVELKDRYHTIQGRPGLAPEAALRLMLAGFLLGIVHDRKLMREAQVNLAIRWFAGFGGGYNQPFQTFLAGASVALVRFSGDRAYSLPASRASWVESSASKSRVWKATCFSEKRLNGVLPDTLRYPMGYRRRMAGNL